jgi:hypothetical protein
LHHALINLNHALITSRRSTECARGYLDGDAWCVSRRPVAQPTSKHATSIATGRRIGCRSPVQCLSGY